MLRWCITGVVLCGSLVYLYFYQLWPRRHASVKAVRIGRDPLFNLFYRYLQVSTPVYAGFRIAHHQIPWHASIAWSGLMLSIASILLFAWSMLSLRAEYSHCFDSYVANTLVERGPYASIRHPIYVANCIMLAGLFVATASWAILANATVLSAFYYRATRKEEAALIRHLPGYRDYVRRTGRFIPRWKRSGRGPVAASNGASGSLPRGFADAA